MDKETIKNFSDPYWRLENLYKIKSKTGEIVNLIPNEAQKKFLEEEEQNNVILKARQLGMSTLCLIRLLDKALFTPNTTCVILAHKKESVQKLFKIIKFAYENYPTKYPKAVAKYNTKSELDFNEINSKIYVATEIRGDTIDHLHISEMAFMDEAEDKFIATVSAVTPTGTTTIESTANGIGDYFYDFYMGAEDRDFKGHFFPWYLASEYRLPAHGFEPTEKEEILQNKFGLDLEQLAWHRSMQKKLGDKFKQEFPITPMEAFMAAGNNVFDIDLLDKLMPKDPIVDSKEMKVWRYPELGHRYAMGVDPAEGINKDESSIDIIDIDTGEQVWHFSGNIGIPELAEKVEIWAKRYNNAFLIPESNNHGYSLIYLLRERKLHIYKREQFDGPTVKKTKKLGWHTTKRTKPLMINSMKEAIQEDDIKINCKKTISQMKSFVNNVENGTMQAASGKKDDCVISLCLAWQGIRVQPKDYSKDNSFNAFEFEPGTGY